MMVGTYRRLRELIADLGVRCARRRKLPVEPLPKLVLSRLGLIGGNNGQGRSFMSHLRASDVVKCIDDTPLHQQSTTMPSLDRTYTVESVRPVGDGFSVRLVELTPDCWQGGPCACGACGWDASRFRRVRPIRTEQLDVFRAMLGSENELAG